MDDSLPDIPEDRLKAFASSLDITLADVHAFLKSTGWEQAICDVCQNDNFILDVLGDLPAPVLLPAAVSAKHAKWVMAVRCNRCGNTKLLDYVFVRDWVKENRRGD